MTQFAQSFGFDLTDTLTGYVELFADFFQCVPEKPGKSKGWHLVSNLPIIWAALDFRIENRSLLSFRDAC